MAVTCRSVCELGSCSKAHMCATVLPLVSGRQSGGEVTRRLIEVAMV